MSKTSLRSLSDSIRRDHDRFVDLRIDFALQEPSGKLPEAPEILLTVGGRLDRQVKRYVDESPTAKVLGLHPGQVQAARWLADWVEARAQGKFLEARGKQVFSLLLHGGRRGGKTDLAAKIAVAYALFRPRSYV